jgi:hypothetical protein
MYTHLIKSELLGLLQGSDYSIIFFPKVCTYVNEDSLRVVSTGTLNNASLGVVLHGCT